MDTLSAPSLTVIMKCWHEICRQTNFSVRPRRSHSSAPTAVQLRRRVERRSRMAAAWRPPAGLVLDGREHGGRLRRAGANDDQHRFPLPLPVPLQQSGSGSGKPIKCRARDLIKKRDPAQQDPGQYIVIGVTDTGTGYSVRCLGARFSALLHNQASRPGAPGLGFQ